MFKEESIVIEEWNQRIQLRIEQNENSDHPYVYILINNGVIAVDELHNHRTERHDNNLRTAAFMSAISYLQDAQLCLTEQMIHGANKEYNVPEVVQPPSVPEEELSVPVRVRTAKLWSAEENNTLMMMYYNGVPYAEIAKALNRTVIAVGNRINIYQNSMNLTRRKNRSK